MTRVRTPNEAAIERTRRDDEQLLKEETVARNADRCVDGCGYVGEPMIPRGTADPVCPACGDDWPRIHDQFPQLDPDAPAVPANMKPREGVEYGCGDATCGDCYEPLEPEEN